MKVIMIIVGVCQIVIAGFILTGYEPSIFSQEEDPRVIAWMGRIVGVWVALLIIKYIL